MSLALGPPEIKTIIHWNVVWCFRKHEGHIFIIACRRGKKICISHLFLCNDTFY